MPSSPQQENTNPSASISTLPHSTSCELLPLPVAGFYHLQLLFFALAQGSAIINEGRDVLSAEIDTFNGHDSSTLDFGAP
jgi:hypothetical protein